MIQRDFIDEEVEIVGIAVSLIGEGRAKAFKLKEDETLPGVKVSGGNEIIELPDQGEARTYIFNETAFDFKLESAEVSAILGKKICDSTKFSIASCP